MADYYDIDDILAEEEFVPVLFHKAVNGVKIDESSERGFVSFLENGELLVQQRLCFHIAVSLLVYRLRKIPSQSYHFGLLVSYT
ncbi:hypothetical protein LINGRAHAP2_LOCUS1952 [Linum grandiflorum]